jgi:hypothetical protein
VTDEGIWLYAVAPATARRRLPAAVGVAGEPVYQIEAAGLTAVVGSVPLAGFGAEALRGKLNEMSSLEAVVRAHHAVVEALAQVTVVLPARLGTLYRDAGAVSGMLGRRAAALTAGLDRVTGRAELGVKGYATPGETAAQPGTGPPGTAYLLRRRAQLTAAEDAWRTALADADKVHAGLSRAAVAARRHRPQDPRLAGKRDRMVLNGAYLVDKREVARFAATVRDLSDRYRGLELELTGPWPPYSFAVGEAG